MYMCLKDTLRTAALTPGACFADDKSGFEGEREEGAQNAHLFHQNERYGLFRLRKQASHAIHARQLRSE